MDIEEITAIDTWIFPSVKNDYALEAAGNKKNNDDDEKEEDDEYNNEEEEDENPFEKEPTDKDLVDEELPLVDPEEDLFEDDEEVPYN